MSRAALLVTGNDTAVSADLLHESNWLGRTPVGKMLHEAGVHINMAS
jgi:hypothetical protein